MDATQLPGRPDLAFFSVRLAVFCDGDFWHGRHWEQRKISLHRGHNASYWIAKIERNRARDGEVDAQLRAQGWRSVRVWEGDVRKNAPAIARKVLKMIAEIKIAKQSS